MEKTPTAFVSYINADKAENQLLRKFVNDLMMEAKFYVWLADQEISPGDSIANKLHDGIKKSRYFIYCITESTKGHRWSLNEFRIAYAKQFANQEMTIIPLLFDDVKIPDHVSDLQYIDFTKNYNHAWNKLHKFLGVDANESIARFDLFEKDGQESLLLVSDKISKKLIEYFSRNPEELKRLNRRKFEELVAELFSGFGYEVELTQQTRDGGRDIIAIKNSEIKNRYLIECKRPGPNKKVGVKPVRELLGVKHHERATKAIFATTAFFTRDAKLFFERNEWELEPRDYDGVIDWLKLYNS